jgi:RNA polymerase-binding transcription factor
MDARTRAVLVQALRRQRTTLLKQYLDAEDRLRSMAEDREAEIEERAQEDRAARVLAGLDDRSLREVAEVHAALQRVIDGTYGRCIECGEAVPVARLRALPTAATCLECARERETAGAAAAAPVEPHHPGRLPADLDPLLDREVEEALRELVRDDGRVDTEELRLVCRHGVVHLEGAVPSEAEHRMLVKLVTDVAGCEDVVDHVAVNELLWERPDRSRRSREERTRPARFEPIGTEDVVESAERGLDYLPPDRPPPEEE